MSDRMDWILPTAAWSTCVSVQLGSAIREWWMDREAREQRRRLEASDWMKVRRGETKRGYRLWLEPRCCPYSRRQCHNYVAMAFANDDERMEEDTTSVFMMVKHQMPNNADQYAVVLQRYSIFTTSVYTDIARVVYQYDPMEELGWVAHNYTQLDERTVVLLFKRQAMNQMRAILVDVEEKSSQLLEITSPPGIGFVLFICRHEESKKRFRIVYLVQGENLQELITVDYEIGLFGADPSRLIVSEVASQSITIPGRRGCSRYSISGTFLLESDDPKVRSFVITFDRRGNYQIDSYDEWWRNYNASVPGQQWNAAAIDSQPSRVGFIGTNTRPALFFARPVLLSVIFFNRQGRVMCCVLLYFKTGRGLFVHASFFVISGFTVCYLAYIKSSSLEAEKRPRQPSPPSKNQY